MWANENPKVDTRSRELNLGPYDCETDDLKSCWLLSHMAIYETTIGIAKEINPATMNINNLWKETGPAGRSKHQVDLKNSSCI